MKVATNRPIQKVSAGAVAGALVAILAWGLRRFAGVDVPDEVTSAAVVLISFAAAYLTPIADGEIVP